MSSTTQPETISIRTPTEMSIDEYDMLIEKFIQEAAERDGSLPLETFLETWEALDQRRAILEIKVQVIGDRLVLAAPPDSPLIVRGNHILLEDGREIIITLTTQAITS